MHSHYQSVYHLSVETGNLAELLARQSYCAVIDIFGHMWLLNLS